MNDSNIKSTMLKKHSKLVNYIRHSDCNDISAIAESFKVSWPTMKTLFNNLYKHNILIESNETKSHKHVLNEEYGYMLGIAVGATETKVTLINFNFEPVNWLDENFQILFNNISHLVKIKSNDNVLCYETKHDYLSIHNNCSNIIKTVINFCIENNLCLLSVGISLPGIVDKRTKKMMFCPNMPELLNIKVTHIVSDEIRDVLKNLDISLYISHDSTAATVYEKEWTYKQYFEKERKTLSKNMAVIYLGSGLASGYIFENKLLLGTSGTVGEIGHLDLTYNDLDLQENETKEYVVFSTKEKQLEINAHDYICMCGKRNCLETLIRTKVFNSSTTNDFLKKTSVDALKKFKTDNPYRYRVLCHFISQLLNITINMLNVDTIILTGRVLNGIPELKKDINSLKTHSSLGCFSEDCEISFGSSRADTVAIGAAILSYYSLFYDPKDEFKIEW